jgi:hypothetical protein
MPLSAPLAFFIVMLPVGVITSSLSLPVIASGPRQPHCRRRRPPPASCPAVLRLTEEKPPLAEPLRLMSRMRSREPIGIVPRRAAELEALAPDAGKFAAVERVAGPVACRPNDVWFAVFEEVSRTSDVPAVPRMLRA